MSATDVSASPHCLIEILRAFGCRVFNIRRRISRLKMRIERAEKQNQPTTTLESEKEELLDELDRYEHLLNSCAGWIRDRKRIPTSKLVEVATSPAFTDGEDWDQIYADLQKLDERGETAKLWKALLSEDQDALVSVKLLPSSESSPPATETPIVASHPVSPPKEKWPREEYARDAIIRLKENSELQSNILAFCRTIAEERGVPEIAGSLKKLLYQSEYQSLWRPAK